MYFATGTTSKPNPKLNSNFFSNLTFWWVLDIFLLAKDGALTGDDIYDALPEDESGFLSQKLEAAWENELKEAKEKKEKPSLWRAVIKTFRYLYLIRMIVCWGYCITSLLQPLLLKHFLAYFHSKTNVTTNQAIIYGTLLSLSMFAQSFMIRHIFVLVNQIGMKARISCTSLVFKKAIRLSYLAVNSSTAGSIINLMSSDVSRFELFLGAFSFSTLIPIQLIAVTYLMWVMIGPIALFGTSIMIIQSLPLQALIYILSKKYCLKLNAKRDERISLINETINGIRTIKMYVWEKPFEKLIYHTRSQEIRSQMKISVFNALSNSLYWSVQRTSGFFLVFIYVIIHGTISAEQTVSIMQFLNVLLITLVANATFCAHTGAHVNTSMKRIQNFLLLDEVKSYVKIIESKENKTSISISNVTASWDATSESDNYSLQDICLDINSNELCIVTGIVGSGKSTLLKLMLDEFPPIRGEVYIRREVSYASQEPWLFPASIRDNILFGEKYNKDKYQEVIQICALVADFKLLPFGDKTLIGERGMSLSGGQCARINLARAIYKDADVYLLDDPLSAVDIHVNKRIFQECINGYLKNKTKVLVTQNIEHFEKADQIVLINKGRINFQGPYSVFHKNDKHLKYLVSKIKKDNHVSEKKEVTTIESSFSKSETDEIDEEQEEAQENEELLAKGYIAKSVYWKYIKASGSLFFIFFLLLFIASQVFIVSFDYWLLCWTKQMEIRSGTISGNTTFTEDNKLIESWYAEKSMLICGLLLVVSIILIIANNLLFWILSLKASTNIHNEMISCVMKTPLSFFQHNPAGRILNRFSKDTETADEILTRALIVSITGLTGVCMYILTIIIIDWWNILPLIIFIFLIAVMTKHYLLAIQTFSRLEGNAKSPILSMAISSITGLLTIRSHRMEKSFSKAFNSRQNYHTSVVYLNACTAAASGLFSQLMVSTFFTFFAYMCVGLKDQIYASDAGYILGNLLTITLTLQHSIRHLAEAFAYMTSVERMIQFTKLEQEKLVENEVDVKVPKLWPNKGGLKFTQVYLRYSDVSEPALKNLTFCVDSGSKIGIVGRTGAGKSSLIAALFRLSNTEGTIFIDDIDIKSVCLSVLRSKISIIPQEPFLFTATLRNNVDPLNEFDDASIWSALEGVELNQTFFTLDHPIKKGGSNLSVGQRQLVCLARAILKKNKILILDEATANVDSTTDALIQKTIRSKFVGCTVLTIAHRLNTIMDNDKILVIEKGEAVEFDHPYILLQRKDSYFFKMVQGTGNATAQHLAQIAEVAHNQRPKQRDNE